MAIAYILYNKKAGEEKSFESVYNLEQTIPDEIKLVDVLELSDYKDFISKLSENDYIIVAGGDGTLNRYINYTYDIDYNNKVFYFPNGSGNDFARDMGYEKECKPFEITHLINNLPYVTVNGEKHYFINGIGYGIDGYCCEVGDNLRKNANKKIDYTSIAIKGLLFYYKPTNAKVTVDGATYNFKKVWIAPTMEGRHYGGGMMPTPAQERCSGKVSTMVFHGSGKIHTLMMFPSLFKGEHLKYKKHVSVFTGKKATVEFDRPVTLQIDGETITGVTSYTVHATDNSTANKKAAETAAI